MIVMLVFMLVVRVSSVLVVLGFLGFGNVMVGKLGFGVNCVVMVCILVKLVC